MKNSKFAEKWMDSRDFLEESLRLVSSSRMMNLKKIEEIWNQQRI